MTDIILSENAIAPARPKSPAFTEQEHQEIASWCRNIAELGFRTEVRTDHVDLSEALHLTADGYPEFLCIVHKTPNSMFAVRLWPGIADVMPNLATALHIALRELGGPKHVDEPLVVRGVTLPVIPCS